MDDSAYAPDGSPIALYASLPAMGEPELIHGAVPAGSEILELLKATSEAGQTIVMVTHDAKTAEFADRTIGLLDGRLENGAG